MMTTAVSLVCRTCTMMMWVRVGWEISQGGGGGGERLFRALQMMRRIWKLMLFCMGSQWGGAEDSDVFSGAAEAEHLNILSVLEDSGREAVVMWLRLLLEGESRGHDDTEVSGQRNQRWWFLFNSTFSELVFIMVKPSVANSWMALKVKTDKNWLCNGFYMESWIMEPGEMLQGRWNVRGGRILTFVEDLEDWSNGTNGVRCEWGV